MSLTPAASCAASAAMADGASPPSTTATPWWKKSHRPCNALAPPGAARTACYGIEARGCHRARCSRRPDRFLAAVSASPGISFAPPSSPERGGRGCFSPQAKKPPPRCSRHFRECGQRADISQLGASRSQQRHGQKTMPQRRTTPQQSEETIPLQDYLPLQP